MLKYFIDASLAHSLLSNKNVVFLDCRFQLNDVEYGPKAYKKSHIPGAKYLDLNKHLSSEVQKHGGRHPLPNLIEFGNLLGEIGIDHETIIICYDDGFNENAARCWFLCQLIGHQFTFILNGGFNLWLKNNFEITDVVDPVKHSRFTVIQNNEIFVNMEEVSSKLNDPDVNIIDSREYSRYSGEHEPIDRVAGHIPGAKQSFWKDVLNEDGTIKSKEELIKHFSQFDQEKESIVYCGSGVTGCVNYIGLIEAGFKNVKLYPGSFSDWISYEKNDVNKVNL